MYSGGAACCWYRVSSRYQVQGRKPHECEMNCAVFCRLVSFVGLRKLKRAAGRWEKLPMLCLVWCGVDVWWCVCCEYDVVVADLALAAACSVGMLMLKRAQTFVLPQGGPTSIIPHLCSIGGLLAPVPKQPQNPPAPWWCCPHMNESIVTPVKACHPRLGVLCSLSSGRLKDVGHCMSLDRATVSICSNRLRRPQIWQPCSSPADMTWSKSTMSRWVLAVMRLAAYRGAYLST
jgi:hypothetical protein